MITLNRSLSQSAAILRFEQFPLVSLERILLRLWNDMLSAGQPKEAYGNLTFQFKDELGLTFAVVNAGFVELRSDKEDPTKLFPQLVEGILAEHMIQFLALTIEAVAVLEAPEGTELDITAELKRPFTGLLETFNQRTQSEVVAVGTRLYIRHDSIDGLYAFDINPYFGTPHRQLFLRLRSRRGGAVTIEQFKKALSADFALFNTLVSTSPQIVISSLSREA